ncbi:hypothetical protein FOA43_001532 [Brettanomyces nanus]|uniref:CASTOR ACT domain-containing protein n=1 Tax=Eeniella nana TaxID=13502 RepID=A0A875RZQ0_EENNA|nr:uncharacterized protein FOA43_001532 [Brettanomyces nanus]QPG74208.1 hypothetical protein FOA43_001532 [Brettanomyces nanus]
MGYTIVSGFRGSDYIQTFRNDRGRRWEAFSKLAEHYEGSGGGTRNDMKYDTDLSASSMSSSSSSACSNSNKLDLGYLELEDFAQVEDDGLFFHLAFAMEEVTLMCSHKLMKRYLGKTMEFCRKCLEPSEQPTLLEEKFLMLQVFSDGLNIGKKILELTEPLSLDGISLFFISNFFSDIVLIPAKDRRKALTILNRISKKQTQIQEELKPEKKPDLESKTFELFKSQLIQPKLIDKVKLLLTGARSGDCGNVLKRTAEALCKLNTDRVEDGKNKDDNFPAYFAITRTCTGEISLMLPQEADEMRKLNYDKSTIMGSLQDSYYPVFIDLSNLPLDLKGIVAGVASKLVKSGLNEMSYLSFGKSGVVLIPDNFHDTVEQILQGL